VDSSVSRLICSFLCLAMAVAWQSAAHAKVVLDTPFQDCELCPTVIKIPAGRFIMGTDEERPEFGPAHDVAIRRPFAIAVTETTFEQYAACVKAGACLGGQDDHSWGRGRQPLINVTWQDSVDYTLWLSSLTGQVYRLPSEAEWEYAARSGSVNAYPWGDEPDSGRANCRNCGTRWSGIGPAPVASLPPNAFSLHDMHGNLSEWVADCWNSRHSADHREQLPRLIRDDESQMVNKTCEYRVTKGGDWYYVPALATSSARMRNRATLWSYTIGFRVVRNVP